MGRVAAAVSLVVLLAASAVAQDEEKPSFATILADGRRKLERARIEDAEARFKQARELATKEQNADDERCATFWLAQARLRAGDAAGARQQLHRAMGARVARFRSDPTLVALAPLDAEITALEGDADRARARAHSAGILAGVYLGREHPETARAESVEARMELVSSRNRNGGAETAKKLLEHARSVFEALGCDPAEPDENFAPVLRLQAQIEAVEQLDDAHASWFATGVRWLRALDPAGGREVGRWLVQRADAEVRKGSLRRAELELAGATALLPPLAAKDAARAELEATRGQLALARGRLTAAERSFHEAKDLVPSTRVGAVAKTRIAVGLARLAIARGHAQDAAQVLVNEAPSYPMSASPVELKSITAEIQAATGEPGAACRSFRDALRAGAVEQDLGAVALARRGACELADGQRSAARRTLDTARALADATLDADDPRRAEVLDALASAADRNKARACFADAAKLREAQLAALEAECGEKNADLVPVLAALAKEKRALGDEKAAQKLEARAAAIEKMK